MVDFTAPLAGIEQAADRFDAAARRIALSASDAVNSPAGVDSVDLSAQMLELIQARNAFAANVRVAHVVDDMNRVALDQLL
jgi:hypothetical protein